MTFARVSQQVTTVPSARPSASWLNAVGSWFSTLERRSIYRGVFASVKELRDEIHRFIKAHNERNAKPFKWTKTASSILEAVERAKQSV